MRHPFRLFCMVLLSAAAVRAQAAERVVLAVPARHLLVNFAFALADLAPRDLDLVCYGARPVAGAPVELNFFDRVEWRWVAMDVAAWQRGDGLRSGAARLILVENGSQSDALKETGWARSIQTVDGRQLSDVANAAGKVLRFSPEQWRALADTYGFKLDDRNANVRRYGRYGPPGRRLTPSQPVPVAPVMEFTLTPDETNAVAHPVRLPDAPETQAAEVAESAETVPQTEAVPQAEPATAPTAKAVVRPEDK